MRAAGVGIDILELERIKGIKNLRRFAEYFLTGSEIKEMEKSPDQTAFAASRFAAKEAVIKAFPGKLRPHDFEIRKKGAKPIVTFVPPRTGLRALLSISHSEKYVAGCAFLFKNKQ